jgi:hypothetical protein
VIGALAGQPRERWGEAVRDATAGIKAARNECTFTAKQNDHRRGHFPALAVGVSYGGGRKVSHLLVTVRLVTSVEQEPLNVKNSERNAQALSKLCSSTSIARIAGFQSNVFAAYAPRVYEFYSSNLNILLNQSPFLRQNFQRSVFSAMTINFGPVTVTKPHTDPGNLSWGQCVITSLGEFNADLGGHLALWHLGLVIRFPPGSSILIPSAILLHTTLTIDLHDYDHDRIYKSDNDLLFFRSRFTKTFKFFIFQRLHI